MFLRNYVPSTKYRARKLNCNRKKSLFYFINLFKIQLLLFLRKIHKDEYSHSVATTFLKKFQKIPKIDSLSITMPAGQTRQRNLRCILETMWCVPPHLGGGGGGVGVDMPTQTHYIFCIGIWPPGRRPNLSKICR